MPVLAPSPAPDWAAAAAAIQAIPQAMAYARIHLTLTTAQQAKQVGISTPTLTKLGTTNPTQTTILACLTWLATVRS